MRHFRFTALFLMAAFLSVDGVYAFVNQNDASAASQDSAVFILRFDDSSTEVRPQNYNNESTLAAIDAFWKKLKTNKALVVTDISLVGNASWEGDFALNKRLGEIRAWTTANYLSRMIGIDSNSMRLDMASWLKNKEKIPIDLASPQMRSARNRCCRIVISYGPRTSDSVQLAKESTEAISVSSIPELTVPASMVDTVEDLQLQADTVRIAADTVKIAADTAGTTDQTIVAVKPTWEQLKNPWTLKTNLLYDAATVANLSLEAGFCKHWAIDIMATFSPWDIRPTFKIRTLLIQPEVRYYLKKSAFTGHYFGIEGHYGWYNIALPDSPTRYQDCNGDTPLWGAGLTYGYVLPFGKHGNHGISASHWGMDFEIGVGYAHLEYDCFYNIENGARYTTGSKDWFGPTKLGISVYYRF